MYWVYQTKVYSYRRKHVQARLVTHPIHALSHEDCGYGFRGPKQLAPYGVDLRLTYCVDPKHPHPDNYFESFGFTLYSGRLVTLMASFGVKAEYFPVTVVDKAGTVQPHLEYYVFHSLEGVLDAMDEERSGWIGDGEAGVSRLVLRYGTFDRRPVFRCNHIYVSLMRDDLKQEISRQGITGLAFLDPERYRSGVYGLSPGFDD